MLALQARTLIWSPLGSLFHFFVIISKMKGPQGGGTLIRRLELYFGFKILNFNIFWGFSEKWIFFGGMKILWIFFGGHHKIGLVWGSFLCNLGSFLRSRYRIGIFFLVAKSSNIFFGVLEIPYILLVNGRCWVRAYECRKKLEYPPPPGDRPKVHRMSEIQLIFWIIFYYK